MLIIKVVPQCIGKLSDIITIYASRAAANHHCTTLQLLGAYGGNVNEQNNSGETPLHIACQPKSEKSAAASSLQCVKTLLSLGANPTIKNKKKHDPSYQASPACIRLIEKAMQERLWERLPARTSMQLSLGL